MLPCMRTSFDLDDSLLRQLKKKAAERGCTMRELVEEALRAALAPTDAKRQRPPFRWVPSKSAGGLLPGVDLDDRDSLLDRMGDPT